MLKPDLFYQRVTQITPSALRVMQIRALLLDVDNTLARHGVPEPSPGTLEWAALMIESGFRL